MARGALLLSALTLIPGTPVMAASGASMQSTALSQNITQPATESSITVNNYAAMLNNLAATNEDQNFYDIYSMPEQLSLAIDFQGNRTYQAVEGQGEELLQNLTEDDIAAYSTWSSSQLAGNKSTFAVASGNKSIAKNDTAALLLTPNQIKKVKDINEALGNATKHPLANNVFENKAILTAIMSYLASLGLGASASTINTAANLLGNAAFALGVIGLVPIIAEHIGHQFEGRARKIAMTTELPDGEHTALITNQTVQQLINQENTNRINTDKLRKTEVSEDAKTMVYGYISPTGERFARFATNWRTFFSPAFKLIGINIPIDELHLSHTALTNPSELAFHFQEQQNLATQTETLLQKALEGQVSVLDPSDNPLLTKVQSLKENQQGFLIGGIKYATDSLTNFVSGKLETLDNWWEEYQISVRKGGFSPTKGGDTGTVSSSISGGKGNESGRKDSERARLLQRPRGEKGS